jgi:hypothetical protein
MAIHIAIDYPGGVQAPWKNRPQIHIQGGKAAVAISADYTWSLLITPNLGWWPKDDGRWLSGTWSGDEARANFWDSTKNGLVFGLNGFHYPPMLNTVDLFHECWVPTLFSKSGAGTWRPLLTDELLQATIEEFDRIQREIIQAGIQGGLDAVSILDQSGITSFAAAGYALSCGNYGQSALELVSAVPLLGKFLGGLPAAGSIAARVVTLTKEAKEIETAIRTTEAATKEIGLAKVLSTSETTVKEVEAVQPLKVIAASGKATKLRDLPGAAPTVVRVLNQTDRWLGGGNALAMPQKLAGKFAGRSFTSFRNFKEQFWIAVSRDSELSKAFAYDSRNLSEMSKGNAPFVKAEHQAVLTKAGNRRKSFRTGRAYSPYPRIVSEETHITNPQVEVVQKYVLHHKTPIQKGGATYDPANILVVTGLYHETTLYEAFHFGKAP